MEDNRQIRMDAQVKKSIDARTKEFKEKLAKLTYEKIKQALVPSLTPLRGYPANESLEEGKKIQDIARKHKRELQKIQRSGNLELSKKAEDELYQWASNSGEIHGDEEDEFWNWIDQNVDDLVKGRIKEDKSLPANKRKK